MKNTLLFVVVTLFSTGVFSQSYVYTRNVNDTSYLFVRLIDSVDRVPNCGIRLVNLELKFLLKSNTDFKEEVIIRFQCPNERFGKNYFIKNKEYFIRCVKIENSNSRIKWYRAI